VDCKNADVAQLVARNLAKVQVAGSNPVVRSDAGYVKHAQEKMVGWPRGEAQDCKSCYTGSNPVPTSILNSLNLAKQIS
jgi:hypothetical protein